MATNIDSGLTAPAAEATPPSVPAIQIGTNILNAMSVNPDREAEYQAIARRTGLPVDTVKAFPDDAKAQATWSHADTQKLVTDSPYTAAMMLDQNLANIGHDDVHNLSAIEGAAKPGLLADVWPSLKGVSLKMGGNFANILGSTMNMVDLSGDNGDESAGRSASAVLADPAAKAAFQAANKYQPKRWTGMVASGLAYAPYGPAAPLMVAGSEGGAVTQQLEDSGVDPYTAKTVGGNTGAIMGTAQLIPMGNILWKQGATTLVKSGAVTGLKAAAVGGGQELVTDTANSAYLQSRGYEQQATENAPSVAKAADAALFMLGLHMGTQVVLSPVHAKGEASAAPEQAPPAKDAATAASDTTPLPDDLPGHTARDMVNAIQADADGQTLRQITDASAASKLRERDPDAFHQHVTNVTAGGPVQDLYVDGKTFAQSMADNGVTVPELAAKMPDLTQRLADAIQTGGDVRVPTADYATHLAGTDLGNSLFQHIKTEPDGMTQADADRFMQEHADNLRQEVEAAMTQQNHDAEFRQSIEGVRSDLAEQLNQTGRFRRDVNDQYAALVAQFYGVQAARLGVTPKELFAQHPLDVRSFIDHKPDQALHQAEIDPYAFALAGWHMNAADKEDAFRYPTSDSKHLADIAQGIDPGIKIEEGSGSEVQEARNITGKKINRVYLMRMPREVDAGKGKTRTEYDAVKVYQTGKELWINAADLKEGVSGGSKVYAAVGNFAHNTKRVFIGDPLGLSDIAALRRTEHMHSLALKFGTTDFMMPHERQVNPDGLVQGVIRPLDWRVGSDEHNLLELTKSSYHNTAFFSPEIKNVRYDPDSGHFLDRETGKPITDDVWRELQQRYEEQLQAQLAPRADTGAAGGTEPPGGGLPKGSATLKRAAFVDTFLREGSSEGRRSLLAAYGGQLSGALSNDLRKLLYQGGDRRGAYSPDTRSIALFEKADLSTFLHESGHHFLEVMADLAGRADAPEPIKADMQKVLDWFGVKDADTWKGMTLEQQRDFHEQFARGFEAYLFEGKAPSVELQGVFNRFRAWLLNVYRSLSNLNVTLTDDVRGVFDRMLASTEHIQDAEQARNLLPALQTKPDGMSDDMWQLYKERSIQATQDAVSQLETRSLRDMKWLSNARSRVLRQLQKEAADKRRVARVDARREVLSQPVYQARSFLLAPTEPAPKVEAPSKDSVDPRQDTLLKAVAKLGGINREQAAEQFGLDLADFQRQPVFGKPVLRAEGGLSPDGMAEALHELGYMPVRNGGHYDLHDLGDLLSQAGLGADHFSRIADFDLIHGDKDLRPAPDSEQIPFTGGRLAKRILQEMYGTHDEEVPWEDLGSGRFGMINNEGMHPDEVAERFGYDSGDALVRDLLRAGDATDAIEALTDRIMLERHGDLTSPQAVARAVDEALHNDARSRFVSSEMNALNKLANRNPIVERAIKEHAEQIVARQRIRDIRPFQYSAAEGRASKASAAAAAKQDYAAAAREKQNELVNNYAGRAARKALDEVTSGVEYFKKFDKESIRKNLPLDYRERIDDLLERFDFRTAVSGRALDKRSAFAEWVADQRARGYEPNVPDYLLDDANRTHYKNMTAEEFRGLVDTVKSIEHLARLKQELLVKGQRVAFDDAVQAAVTQMEKLPELAPETNRGLSRSEKQWFGAKQVIAMADSSLLKVEQMMDWLDSHDPQGPMNTTVFRRIADAGVRENDLLEQITARLNAVREKLPADSQRDLDTKYQIPHLLDSETGKPATLTKREILAVALNTGNHSNFDKLLEGEKWSREGVRMLLNKHMSKADWDFVQGIWDAVNSLWPEIEAMERRLGNTVPDKVEAAPFNTPHGTYQGGYYPMMYDPVRSFDIEQKSAKTGDSLFENTYQKATTAKGHTQSRVKYAAPVWLSLDALPRHINQVVRDIAYREALMDADRFLGDDRVRESIEDRLGREYYKQLRPWLQSIANAKVYDSRGLAFWDRAAHKIRTNATMVGLGYRFTTMMIHGLTAGSNSIGEIGAKWFGNGLKEVYGNPAKIGAVRDFVFERSGEMRNRMNEVDRDVRDVLREMDLAAQSSVQRPLSAGVNAARRFAFYGIAMLDMGSALPTWVGAYNKGLHEGLPEADAVYAADKAVRNAHGGTSVKDLAAIQRGSEFQKLFTMFYSFWNHFYNRQRDIGRSAAAIPGQIKAGDYAGARRDFAMVLARSWFYFVIPQLLHAALKPPAPGQDHEAESWLVWCAKEIGAGLFSGIPVARDLATSVTRDGFTTKALKDGALHTPAASTVTGALAPVVDAVHAAHGDKVSDKWLKHAVESPGYVFGLPTGQVSTSAQFLWDVHNGKQDPRDLADWWNGVIYGNTKHH